MSEMVSATDAAGTLESAALPLSHDVKEGTVLVTGATGYVGGRLVPLLLERGYRVRALVRSRRKLACRPWANNARLEIVEGDLLHPVSTTSAGKNQQGAGHSVLHDALSGCFAAFYLVHSMGGVRADFEKADRKAAYNFVRALQGSGVERVVYLSGLVPEGPRISPHLQSRAEVAEILSLGEAAVTTLRAAQILGSGSASFELVRYLVDRLPIMITPKWVRMQCQPIAVTNVLEYLVGVLEHSQTSGKTYDIGGPDVVTYRELFDVYAEEAGLRRRLIFPVPVLTPRLSSLWLNLITPVPTTIARPLVEGLRNRVVCADDALTEIIPQELMPVREAIRRAVDLVKQHSVPTCWTDAGTPSVPEWVTCGDVEYAGGTVLAEGHAVHLAATVQEVWHPVQRIGGETGWYQSDFLWRLRGIIDKMAGGPGLRRGRRDPVELFVGDALDFWRVIDIQPEERLLLQAEMKVPGDALLEFRVTNFGDLDGVPQTELTMTAYFLPRGIGGILYWYSLLPMHSLVFGGMLKAVAEQIQCPVLKGPFKLDRPFLAPCTL